MVDVMVQLLAHGGPTYGWHSGMCGIWDGNLPMVDVMVQLLGRGGAMVAVMV